VAGLDARVAVAANPDAAVHCALGFRGLTIVPEGREAEVLASLPLFLLGGSAEFARSMDLWGIRSFGEFAALPPLGIASRLGNEGMHLQQLACGGGHRQLRLRSEPLVFRTDEELEDPIHLVEPLLFLLAQMLGRLCERLRFHGRATNELRLRLKLARLEDHTLQLRLPVPMLDSMVLLKLLQLELNARPPKAAVLRIHLELMPVEPRSTQHGLFVPSSPEPEKLEITLTRIRALVGAQNVGSPELVDTHRSDSFRLRSLSAPKTSVHPAGNIRPQLTVALRRFRPALPLRIWFSQAQPVRVSSSLGSGRVTCSAGPWPTSGEWWARERWNCEEWDIEVERLGVLLIFHHNARGEWFLAGRYD
jgi:protein ImuB